MSLNASVDFAYHHRNCVYSNFFCVVRYISNYFCIWNNEIASFCRHVINTVQGCQSWGGWGGDTSPPIFRLGGTNI